MDSSGMDVKFMSWLLQMGYPPDQMLSKEKFKEYFARISRGHQYGKVWKNLTQTVKHESVIFHERNAVFLDDVRKYENAEKRIDKRLNLPYLPPELSLWKETKCLQREIEVREKAIAEKKRKLAKTVGGIDLKKRSEVQRRCSDESLRCDLLSLKMKELKSLSGQLDEMSKILDIYREKEGEAEIVIEECLQKIHELLHKYQNSSKQSGPDAVFNSTAISRDGVAATDSLAEKEQLDYKRNLQIVHSQLGSLLDNVTSGQVWSQLITRQGGLVGRMSELAAEATGRKLVADESEPAISQLTNASLLHSTLVLKTWKNRIQIRTLMDKFAQIIQDYCDLQSADGDEKLRLELFVLSCERAELLGRRQLDSSKVLQTEVEEYSCGDAGMAAGDVDGICRLIDKVDGQIMSKKGEIENLLSSLDATGAKITDVSAQTSRYIQSMHASKKKENENYEEFKFFIDQDVDQKGVVNRTEDIYSKPAVLDFYEGVLGKDKSLELSFNLDLDNSAQDKDNQVSPKICQEIKHFLDFFPFGCNRKTVLDSGVSLWLNETLPRLADALPASKCHAMTARLSNVNCLTAVRWMVAKLSRVAATVEWTERLRELGLDCSDVLDISKTTSTIASKVDRIKKGNALTVTQHDKSSKILESALDNVEFWCNCHAGRYLSDGRVVDGESYVDYEKRSTMVPARRGKRGSCS